MTTPAPQENWGFELVKIKTALRVGMIDIDEAFPRIEKLLATEIERAKQVQYEDCKCNIASCDCPNHKNPIYD
jgi:hypothetical protein